MEFRDFYRTSYPRVFTAAYAVCADREVALDVTQDAFEKAFARWPRLRREPWVEGWAITTATNLCRKHFRDASRRRELTETISAPATAGLPGPDHVDLVRALRTLPFRQRQAVVLYYIGDLPVAVVATLMNVQEGSIKAHLAHARKSLEKELEVRNVRGPGAEAT